MIQTKHISVLPQESLQGMVKDLQPGLLDRGFLIDCTLGGGGHTQLFLEAGVRVLACDRDPEAIQRAEGRFEKEIQAGKLVLKHLEFSRLKELELPGPIIGIFADLGYSSDQLEDPQRGLSFLSNGPLDMRLNPNQELSALTYLETVSQQDLENLIRELGEDRFWKRIASTLIRAREEGSLPQTTEALASLIASAVPPKFRYMRLHPATRTFQALRIEVNQELEELDALLRNGVELLESGGRFGIISFHSLEDRRVKHQLREAMKVSKTVDVLTKKPIIPSEEEVKANPRSRSAKLRIAQKR